jgi:hypothetical protein
LPIDATLLGVRLFRPGANLGLQEIQLADATPGQLRPMTALLRKLGNVRIFKRHRQLHKCGCRASQLARTEYAPWSIAASLGCLAVESACEANESLATPGRMGRAWRKGPPGG